MQLKLPSMLLTFVGFVLNNWHQFSFLLFILSFFFVHLFRLVSIANDLYLAIYFFSVNNQTIQYIWSWIKVIWFDYLRRQWVCFVNEPNWSLKLMKIGCGSSFPGLFAYFHFWLHLQNVCHVTDIVMYCSRRRKMEIHTNMPSSIKQCDTEK